MVEDQVLHRCEDVPPAHRHTSCLTCPHWGGVSTLSVLERGQQWQLATKIQQTHPCVHSRAEYRISSPSKRYGSCGSNGTCHRSQQPGRQPVGDTGARFRHKQQMRGVPLKQHQFCMSLRDCTSVRTLPAKNIKPAAAKGVGTNCPIGNWFSASHSRHTSTSPRNVTLQMRGTCAVTAPRHQRCDGGFRPAPGSQTTARACAGHFSLSGRLIGIEELFQEGTRREEWHLLVIEVL